MFVRSMGCDMIVILSDDTGHTSRNGVQVGCSVSQGLCYQHVSESQVALPISRLLLQYTSILLVHPVLISHACTTIPLFVSPLLTAALCSTNISFRLLPVSPAYELLQSIHGISYTTPFFSAAVV